MKKLLLSSLCIISLLSLIIIAISYLHNNRKNEWTTYTKYGENIASYPSTKEELKKIGHDHNTTRAPSSIKNNGRTLFADKNYDLKNKNYTEANYVSKKWKEKLSSNLLKFQNADTKVLINELDSVIMIKNSIARYAEKVMITYLNSDNTLYSANALVDSETGKVIKTWNRARHENDHRKKSPLKPSGTLQPGDLIY